MLRSYGEARTEPPGLQAILQPRMAGSRSPASVPANAEESVVGISSRDQGAPNERIPMPLAISNYEISVFIHVTAVVVGFGATFAESVMFPVALKVGARNLPYLHRLQLTINRFFAGPALLVVLLTGIYQMAEGDWDYGDFWVSGTLAIVIALGALNGAYFLPADRKLGAMVERDIEASGPGEVKLSDEYQRGARLEGILGTVAGLLVIVAIFLMVTKPGV